MIKFSTAVLTASLAAVSIASAADLPLRSAPPPFVQPPPVFTWTGFYVGANAGAAFDNRSTSQSYLLGPGFVAGSGGTNGQLLVSNRGDDVVFQGGGQIGYNYQFASHVVVGLEADAQYLDFSNRTVTGSNTYTFNSFNGAAGNGLAFTNPRASVTVVGAANPQFYGTVRGRLGYAFNQTLIYATGGLAYGGGDTKIGYAVGGGLEYAFTRNISVKLEGLYVDLKNGNRPVNAVYDVTSNVLAVSEQRRGLDFEVARAGINYRF